MNVDGETLNIMFGFARVMDIWDWFDNMGWRAYLVGGATPYNKYVICLEKR